MSSLSVGIGDVRVGSDCPLLVDPKAQHKVRRQTGKRIVLSSTAHKITNRTPTRAPPQYEVAFTAYTSGTNPLPFREPHAWWSPRLGEASDEDRYTLPLQHPARSVVHWPQVWFTDQIWHSCGDPGVLSRWQHCSCQLVDRLGLNFCPGSKVTKLGIMYRGSQQ